ncbi:DUF2147 domain-containing protein [Nitrosomonas sp. Nm58]|uniref:DUF2147 domain-containing protein n=1 Tax=Nitrosomonas sp. Nm58 TaxID=200126 RepID=UPI0008982A52|nr:DUF2147 domain-containing protein [Nitrosomonas sp. Nm58]SDY80647.1 Uncharacterized conserved protein, DUF2147 family [Nitrosomonas sp. Nm58]
MTYSIITSLLAILIFPAAAHAESNDEVTGLWLTKKQDVAVQIEHCGDEGLCGHIAWLSPEEDAENPALCGTKVLWNMRSKKGDPTEWVGGTLYKADEKKYYSANLRLTDANTLALRAYIGVPMLGKTKKLTRTTESAHPPCHMLDKD